MMSVGSLSAGYASNSNSPTNSHASKENVVRILAAIAKLFYSSKCTSARLAVRNGMRETWFFFNVDGENFGRRFLLPMSIVNLVVGLSVIQQKADK